MSMLSPSYDELIEWKRPRPDECPGIRADCTRRSGFRPQCKQDEQEQNGPPVPCGTGKFFGEPCVKYCNSFVCVPRCPK